MGLQRCVVHVSRCVVVDLQTNANADAATRRAVGEPEKINTHRI
jgi:hypothetical protein